MNNYLTFGVPMTQTLGDKIREFFSFLSSTGEYQLFIDIWEDQGNIDWSLLDVQMAAIRINHILGGTHKDERFDEYWSQCPFLKVPYMVYNPWNTGIQNYEWLVANCPPTGAVLLDVEVIKDGYSPTTYAKEFDIFYKLCLDNGWNVAIYTAEWFLPYLAYWPNADYWWAQWPSRFYPDNTQHWEWSRIHTEMENRGNIIPSNKSQIPGRLKFWQFTGDRLILPGSSKVMDVNLSYGSLADLEAWIGASMSEIWFNGAVEYWKGHRDTPRPFNFHVTKIRRDRIAKIHTNKTRFLGNSEYWWNTRADPVLGKADIVINGDEGWYSQPEYEQAGFGFPVPKGLVVSAGEVYKSSSDETCVQWDENHQVIGMSASMLPGVWNACGGSNILLQDGFIPVRLDDKPSVDPRTAFFWNDEFYFIVTIDGRNDGTLGLTLKETAQFALSLGATDGHNFDGGDSCQLLYNDNGAAVIKNNLPDGTKHSVVNHVGFWFTREPQGETMYEYTVVKSVGLRSYTEAQTGHIPPSMYSTSIGTVPAGTYQTPRPLLDNDGVTWADYNDGQGAIPVEWNGTVYVENFHEVTAPPPVAEPITVKFNPTVDIEIDGTRYGPQTGNFEMVVYPNEKS